MYNPDNPLIVQSDRTVLLEVDNTRYEACRDQLSGFCELEKSPEHIHTYRLTPLSLWNARAAGMEYPEMAEALGRYSKFEVPQSLLADIRDLVVRYGRLKLVRDGERLLLQSEDRALIAEVWNQRRARALFRDQ